MALQTVTPTFKFWGDGTHEQCVLAIDPFDAYLKLYKKQHRNSPKRAHVISDIYDFIDCDEGKKDKDGNVHYTIYPKGIDFRLTTMNVVANSINDILFDDTLWSKHFRYKHKNRKYLAKSNRQSFKMWHQLISHKNNHQIPQKYRRNKICLVPITDDQTYDIDHSLIVKLRELIQIYFGLECKEIDFRKNKVDNGIFRNDETHKFKISDIHHKLSSYYQNDSDIFAIIGVCNSKMNLYSTENKIVHSEHNDATQSAVCSFSRLGIYNKRSFNSPEWLKIRRSAKIILHEIGHLFGLGNCEYFRCLMNSDVVCDCVPLHLCPICLNKLYYAMIKNNCYRNTFELSTDGDNDDSKEEAFVEVIMRGGTDDEKERLKRGKKQIDDDTFNLKQRYKSLAAWFTENNIFRDALFYKNRLKAMNY